MKVRITRQHLLHALEIAFPGVSQAKAGATEAGAEQGSCFVFKNGQVYSFCEEMACNVKTGLPKEIRCAVPAMPLLTLLRNLKEAKINLEMKDGVLYITGKRSWKVKMYIESKIRLPIDVVDPPKEWKKLPKDFCEIATIVQECASTDDKNAFLLTHVHVHPDRLEASDSYQCARYDMETRFSESTLILKNSIKHISALGVKEFSETNGWVHFRGEMNEVVSCRKYHEEYDDTERYFSVKGEFARLPSTLADACKLTGIWSAENGVEHDHIRVELLKNKIRVRSFGVSGEAYVERPARFKGKPIEFMISPTLLAHIASKHHTCEISENMLNVKVDKLMYGAYLGSPEEIDESEEDE